MRYKQSRLFAILSVFSVIVLAGSCSSRQFVDISENGDISCRVQIRLSQMFSRYIGDLSEAAGTGASPESFFDIEKIKEAFRELDGVLLQKISSPEKEVLELSFKVTKSAESLEKGAAGGIFSVSGNNGKGKIRFLMDREKYRKLDSAFGFGENPVTAGLTPQPDNPYTEEEYLDLADYVFGEYSPDAASVLAKSMIEIEVNAPGRIVASSGGRINGRKAVFSIPVVRFLTLHAPVEIEIEYLY